jgi:hypothetical protein
METNFSYVSGRLVADSLASSGGLAAVYFAEKRCKFVILSSQQKVEDLQFDCDRFN